MSYINKYLRNFKPYKLASHKIWTVKPEERERILKLDWNEATVPPSPHVGERLKNLVANGNFYNLYPSTYNQEIASLLAEYTQMPQENIQYFASSDSLHEYIAKLYITVSDPILLLGPTYDNFRLTAEVCGARIYYHTIDKNFEFDKAAFKEDIRRIEPSLVYICNPNNPTGTQHTAGYIRELLNEFSQTLFLIDEAYEEFTGISVKDEVLTHENLLISRTMSKAFALANFRFGYLIASKKNIAYISSIRNPKNITTFAQEAAIGALEDVAYMKEYVAEVLRAKELFIREMNKLSDFLECIYGGGNFVLLVLNGAEHKQALIQWLADQNIYVRDVEQTKYLTENCIRVTIGTREQMERVADSISDFFGEKKDD